MNEQEKVEATQEVVEATQPEPAPQEGVAKVEGKNAPDPIADVLKWREWAEKEIAELRKENAERRIREKRARERAIAAEAKTVLAAKLGDYEVAEAAFKLAKVDGLLRETEDDGVEIDVDALLQKYPFLRRAHVPVDSGANPAGISLRSLEDLASMSPEEINRNWELIRKVFRK